MKSSFTLASERAAAPTGCAYIAPLFWIYWFRWDGSRESGSYQLGARVQEENHSGLQIFADGEWHPVKAFASDLCEPLETSGLSEVWKGEIGA